MVVVVGCSRGTSAAVLAVADEVPVDVGTNDAVLIDSEWKQGTP